MKIETILGGLEVRVSGEGDRIMVLWPSLLMAGFMFDEQIEHFNSKGFRTVLIDPPGQGNSDEVNTHFDMYECAVCVIQVLDHLEINNCVIVGNSWGGMTGALVAALFPHRVEAAVLMNCTSSSSGWYQALKYRMLTLTARTFNGYPSFLLNEAVKAFLGPTAIKTKPELVAKVRIAVKANKIRSACQCVDSVAQRSDVNRVLKTTTVPVLVVAGEEDQTFPVAEVKLMADAIGCQFLVLEKAGHLAALEAPDEVNEIIDKFLQKH
jgi:3-oxoadipate enol-lactonase